MWQRFTERARKMVFYAQEEAGRLGEGYVSTEHLLLGLLLDSDSVAVRILNQMGVPLERIREEIERQVPHGDGRTGQDMQLTPRAKRVIDLAYDEARQLDNNYIGTEHLLLGMIREAEGLAGRVLISLGVDLEQVRAIVRMMQEEAIKKPSGASPSQQPEDQTESPEIVRTKARIRPSQTSGPARRLPLDEAGESPMIRGDLALLRNAEDRPYLEFVPDENDIVPFMTDVMNIKDEYAYWDMVKSGKLIRIAAGTQVKFLNTAAMKMVKVRVLDGDHAGKIGYVARCNLQDIHPDDRPFPPDLTD